MAPSPAARRLDLRPSTWARRGRNRARRYRRINNTGSHSYVKRPPCYARRRHRRHRHRHRCHRRTVAVTGRGNIVDTTYLQWCALHVAVVLALAMQIRHVYTLFLSLSPSPTSFSLVLYMYIYICIFLSARFFRWCVRVARDTGPNDCDVLSARYNVKLTQHVALFM